MKYTDSQNTKNTKYGFKKRWNKQIDIQIYIYIYI